MIEKSYGKKRMRDPKMTTEVTKFREQYTESKSKRVSNQFRKLPTILDI